MLKMITLFCEKELQEHEECDFSHCLEGSKKVAQRKDGWLGVYQVEATAWAKVQRML